jgi:hypothetical protein
VIHPVSQGSVKVDLQQPFKRSSRLLGQLVERLRYFHYSLRTEEASVYWAKQVISGHGLRHTRQMGAPEVEAFLTYLANERHVSVPPTDQALSAILFLSEVE